MTDWILLAAARRLGIPDEELERGGPVMEALEASFRPLARSIPLEVEPAVLFQCPPEDQQ